MGNFFKENSYSIVKLFLNQIGLTVFGTMLCMATQDNTALLIGSSVLSIGMFLFLNYTAVWEIGGKDKIRIDGGRLAPSPLKGVLIAVCANIPNYLLALLIGIGAIVDTAASQSMAVICNFIIRLLNGMYLGIFNLAERGIYGETALLINIWWWFIIITLPSVITGFIAYHLGSKGIRISAKLGIGTKSSEKE